MAGFIVIFATLNGRISGISVVDSNMWYNDHGDLRLCATDNVINNMGFVSSKEYILHYPGNYSRTCKASKKPGYYHRGVFLDSYSVWEKDLGRVGEALYDIINRENTTLVKYPNIENVIKAAKNEGDSNADNLNPWWCEGYDDTKEVVV